MAREYELLSSAVVEHKLNRWLNLLRPKSIINNSRCRCVVYTRDIASPKLFRNDCSNSPTATTAAAAAPQLYGTIRAYIYALCLSSTPLQPNLYYIYTIWIYIYIFICNFVCYTTICGAIESWICLPEKKRKKKLVKFTN